MNLVCWACGAYFWEPDYFKYLCFHEQCGDNVWAFPVKCGGCRGDEASWSPLRMINPTPADLLGKVS